MKRLCGLLLACAIGPAMAQVVERGVDLEYRQVLDGTVGVQIVRTLVRLNSAYDAAKEVEEIQGADNTATWCAALFTGTPSCTSAGDAEYDVTSFAEQAHSQIVKLWECANDQACNANARLTKFRRAANELNGALARPAADPQIVGKWKSAISELASEARGLNDEWVNRLDNVNAQTTQIIGASTAQQLCNNQWFPNSADCGTDENDRLKSEDLKTAMESMKELFDCANDVACTVDQCTAASTPDACCTGSGTGTCTVDYAEDLEKYVRIK